MADRILYNALTAMEAYVNGVTGLDEPLDEGIRTLAEGYNKGGGEVENWELIDDVTVTEADNTNTITITADFTQYKKLRVRHECEATGTGASSVYLNGWNASAYTVSPPTGYNQKFIWMDAIISFDDLNENVVFEGYMAGSTWAQYGVFTSNNQQWITGDVRVLQGNPTTIENWKNLQSVSVWKYGVTFVNARLRIEGVRK